MKNVGIVYDPIYAQHETGSHPEKKERVLYTIDKLKEQKMYGDKALPYFKAIAPKSASTEQILWCHSQGLIDEIQEFCIAAQLSRSNESIDGDTLVSGDSMEASLKAVGGNFAAINAMFEGKIDSGFVLCRPPGHHSNRNSARGFCLFNSIALDVEYLFRVKKLKRVAILDFDAHAGNGTEEIFYDGTENGELLFVSIHQDPRTLYPGTCSVDEIGGGKQEGKIINVTLAPQSGDKCVELVMDQVLLPIFQEFAPQFILFSAGFDGWHADPLTSLGFTQQGFGNIVKKMIPIAEKYASGHMLWHLEGGYNIQALSRSIMNILNVMAGDKILFTENEAENSQCITFTENKLIPALKKILKPFWKCLS